MMKAWQKTILRKWPQKSVGSSNGFSTPVPVITPIEVRGGRWNSNEKTESASATNKRKEHGLSFSDHVFAGIRINLRDGLKTIACLFCVIALSEIFYALNIYIFERVNQGGIVALVIGCFAAACWITK